MKRLFRSIMFIAAAAITFNSCNVDSVDTEKVSADTHKVSFIASQAETRTTMSDVNGVAKFSWEDADVNYIHVFENGERAKDIVAEINDNGAMVILAEFDRSSASSYEYTGFFAPSFSIYPMVPNAQIDEGRYDPMADILVAQPLVTETSQSVESLPLRFKRIVAINKMTLKGLDAGETVSEVKIVSDKSIAGKYDFANERWYNSSDLDKQITVTASSTVNASGEAVVYFVCAPVKDAQLTVNVTTASGKTYSKEFAKTITFAEAGVKYFGVTMEKVDSTPAFVKVTGASDDYSGTYLIVSEDFGVALDGSLIASNMSKSANMLSVSPSNGVIAYSDGLLNSAITFSKIEGGYSLKSKGADYIGHTSESNTGINGDTDPIVNSVVYAGNGCFTISCVNSVSTTYTIAANPNPTSNVNYPIINYYKTVASTYKGISLYKFVGEIQIVNVASVSLDQTACELTVGDKLTLSADVLPSNATDKFVSWSTSDSSVATVENGVVTAKAVGTATITVTTADGGFTATCNVTVKTAPVKTYSSLAALIADGTPTDGGRPVTVTLTNEKIESIYVTSQGYRNGIYLVVPDKTVEIYSRNVPDSWLVGGTVSGTLTECTWKKYNSTWELCPDDWSELSYTAPVMYNIILPIGLAHGSVSADVTSAPQGAVVKLTATPASGYQFSSWSVKDASNKTITVTDNQFTMPASDVTISAVFSVEEDDGYTWPNPVTFNFGELLSLQEWTNSYIEHTAEYKECTVTFSSANKQANTITDAPVTKGQPVTVVMKGSKKIKSLELICKKWAAKKQTITLSISKDAGLTYTETDISSDNFDLVANELESGVNAVKFTFSSSNQIGIASLTIKYE